jgi:aspartate/methionine/tyrosine aminotransferase
MKYSPTAERISGGGSQAWAVHWEAMRQRHAGRAITFLTIGDPDQDAPQVVIDAARDALASQRKGYAPIAGLPAVRAAIAARIARRTGRPCAEANVIVCPGAQAGLFMAMQCIVGPGDEIIACEPVYATYDAVVGATGATLVTTPLRPEAGFHPDLAAIDAAITPRTRAIWINSPHNPTGAVLTRDEIEAIAGLCRRHDLWLLSDEVYEDLSYARPNIPAWSLEGMAERTVVVSSLSKSHAMPGFRLGWVLGPPEMIGHVFNLVLCILYGGPPFIQEGALPALLSDLPEVAAIRADYERRAASFAALLATAPGCCIVPPEGGMFALLDVRGTGLSAQAFAMRLLEEEAIAVVTCDPFGPSAVGHLRISLTLPDEQLLAAGRRIVAFAERLAAA